MASLQLGAARLAMVVLCEPSLAAIFVAIVLVMLVYGVREAGRCTARRRRLPRSATRWRQPSPVGARSNRGPVGHPLGGH
jgi:hypothetical protein